MTQFHCSNTSSLCDHCGKAMNLHSAGDYYCPVESKVRRISAFHCDFGCEVPSHKPGCPFYRGAPNQT